MDSRYLLALCLLCGLEIDCQTFSFMDNPVPNHGYADLGMIGTSFMDSVQCLTDLETCCRNDSGVHRGQWYFPDGDPLRRANSATSPTGIYRCEIPTNAVHDDTDISVSVTVYVGLYTK
jgi:hypothetical protein